MRRLIAGLLFCWFSLVLAQSDLEEKQATQEQEWVLVFDDPRPARSQGWVRSNYGKSGGDYRNALELERFGKKVASKYDMQLRDQWFIPSLGVYCLVVSFNGDQSETISKLKKDKTVQSLQPSNEFELLNERRQPPIEESEEPSTRVDGELPRLDEKLPTLADGEGVVIAIVDSAVDSSHQDLAGSISDGGDFVVAGRDNNRGESHGTAIAGVMMTKRHTKLGVAGISPAATLQAYRGCWESAEQTKTNCNTLSLARALDAVVSSDADILNLSLSGPKDALLDRILQQIIDRGTMVVAAFDPARANSERFPTQRDGVLIVRARGLDNRHSGVFTAPGARVVPRPGNRYDFMHGHSVASAYTSGLLALLKQALDASVSAKEGDLDWRNTSSSRVAEDLVVEILRGS